MTGAIALLLLPYAAAAECRLQPGPTRTVTRVIDGETLVLDDGSQVRLAGALAPRGFDADTGEARWPAAVAARAALAYLTEGRTVILGTSGSARTDRQGRHAAQVFVIEDGRETWVQGQMLCAGHARVYQQKDQRGCLDELLAHEQVARHAGAGVWASGAYQTRAAANSRALETMAGKFVVLTGRVTWVAEGRQTIALGFTPGRTNSYGLRRGVVVMIENGDRELKGAWGGDTKQLEGRQVEVRGWLELRLGRPASTYVIDVSLAGLLVVKGSGVNAEPVPGAAADARPLSVGACQPPAAGTKTADPPAAVAER